jgi:hypothetical protein
MGLFVLQASVCIGMKWIIVRLDVDMMQLNGLRLVVTTCLLIKACFVLSCATAHRGTRQLLGSGMPAWALSPDGLDEVLDGARERAGLSRATCHQLRHTCLPRLREAGMALEAVQAQAGHASIESIRIYLHLADDCWRRSTAGPPRASTRRSSLTIRQPRPAGERRPGAAAGL